MGRTAREGCFSLARRRSSGRLGAHRRGSSYGGGEFGSSPSGLRRDGLQRSRRQIQSASGDFAMLQSLSLAFKRLSLGPLVSAFIHHAGLTPSLRSCACLPARRKRRQL